MAFLPVCASWRREEDSELAGKWNFSFQRQRTCMCCASAWQVCAHVLGDALWEQRVVSGGPVCLPLRDP